MTAYMMAKTSSNRRLSRGGKITMNCPYCNALMEKGLIECSEPINFMKEVRFVNKAKEKNGEFNLAKPPLGGHAYVNVWLRRSYRKIVIDY